MVRLARIAAFDALGQVLQSGRISGAVDWQLQSYSVTGSGEHTFQWRYVKDGSDPGGSDCGWVDQVQWTGSVPQPPVAPMPTEWDQITCTYDPAGRRIEKKYDTTTVVKYVYDGSHCIAEYDGNNQLLRKYIYGPCVDEPICMIEAAGGNAVAYYHFDGLGSVVALTNSAGSTVQLYEYSVYGQVAAYDPDHPNRFMFTGREFDKETGLYYYRARYYHPEIGRFLQADPIGYGDGMNWYAYCGGNPLNRSDPTGLFFTFLNLGDPRAGAGGQLTFAWINDGTDEVASTWHFKDLDEWAQWAASDYTLGGYDLSAIEDRVGWKLSGENESVFWQVQALIFLTADSPIGSFKSIVKGAEDAGGKIKLIDSGDSKIGDSLTDILWNPSKDNWYDPYSDRTELQWYKFPPLAALGHEIAHVYDDHDGTPVRWNEWVGESGRIAGEAYAVQWENALRYAFCTKVPNYQAIVPRPAYGFSDWPSFMDRFPDHPAELSGLHPDITWHQYFLGDIRPFLP